MTDELLFFVLMLREAKHLWILRSALEQPGQIFFAAQNDKPTNFIREISVVWSC
jgi:hypothetical protein